MRALIGLLVVLALAGPAMAQEQPKIVKDGRTWVWNTKLGMYAPEGPGWHYNIDKDNFFRYVKEETAAPMAVAPVVQPVYAVQYGLTYSLGAGACADGQCVPSSGVTRRGLFGRRR